MLQSALLFVLDDVSMEVFEPGLMPNLEALVIEGVRFTLAFSHPVCGPSRTSIGYSLMGRTLGYISDTENAPAGTDTIASHFVRHGYSTAKIGKWHMGGAPSGAPSYFAPIERGFQCWLAGAQNNLDNYTAWTRQDCDGITGTVIRSTEYAPLAQLEAAEGWWISTQGYKFLDFSTNLPHGPFHIPPAEMLDGYEPGQGSAGKYRAMLRAADYQLGRLLSLSGMENTVVIVVSDNGHPPQVLSSTEGQHAKGTTFDGGIHVPMVVRYPGCVPGTTYDELVHIVDVGPAFMDLCGIPMMPITDGQTTKRGYIISEAQLNSGVVDQCVRTKRYKLRNIGGVEEFYDLLIDPQELSPVTNPPAYWLTQMQNKLYSNGI